MNIYHSMTQKKIIDSLKKLTDFSEKFPMLKMEDVNFNSLAQYYQLNPKDFIVSLVLLNAIRNFYVIEQETKKKVYAQIDLMKIKELKVKRQNDKWKFYLYQKEEIEKKEQIEKQVKETEKSNNEKKKIQKNKIQKKMPIVIEYTFQLKTN